MTKQSGLGDQLYVDGYDLSGDIGSLSRIGGGPAALEVTAIDKSAPERVGGLRTGEIAFQAWFNKAAAQAHQVLKLIPTTDTQVSYFKGSGIGNVCASQISKQIGYDPTRGADGSLSLATSAQSNGYGLEWGKQLTAGKRTDTTATSPATGLDTVASASFGGQFYVHLFTFVGTSVTFTIQDSADNATFANVTGGAFTAMTAIGAQRLELLNTTTIRRYVRVITTGTFSSAIFAVNMIKNEIAGQVF
jgi:hypothetical protein